MLSDAIKDLVEGTKQREIWGRLGWIEIQRRYRRTAIGPFWTTLSVGIFIFALGFLWARLWGVESDEFLPYLTCGMIGWGLLSSLIIEGCTTFVAGSSLMQSVRVPLTLLAYAVVWRNIIVLLHNMILVVLVMVFFDTNFNLNVLYFFPAVGIMFINGLWVAILLGGLCCRFRDIQQVVVSLMGVIMFCTPVIWNADRLSEKAQVLIQLNIFYHFVEIFRAPLLGKAPALLTWAIVIAWTILGWVATLVFIAKFRKRIPYWL